MYSGYYYFLTLLFIGAGVYSLTSTGWRNSIRLCCSSSNTSNDSTYDDDDDISEVRPHIQEDGVENQKSKKLSKSAANT